MVDMSMDKSINDNDKGLSVLHNTGEEVPDLLQYYIGGEGSPEAPKLYDLGYGQPPILEIFFYKNHSPSLSPRVLRPPDVPPACAPDLHQLHHLA